MGRSPLTPAPTRLRMSGRGEANRARRGDVFLMPSIPRPAANPHDAARLSCHERIEAHMRTLSWRDHQGGFPIHTACPYFS